MRSSTVALFGEAEKGDFRTAYFCRSLDQLSDFFGNPPIDSLGLHCAIKVLMYDCNLIYFRVKEEGFSRQDYFLGLKLLNNKELIPNLTALCMPGVGDAEILDASSPIIHNTNSILLINESDMYDYMIDLKARA